LWSISPCALSLPTSGMGDASFSTYPATLCLKETIGREEQHRRSYYVKRWPDGGFADQADPYNNDRVPPTHQHRAFVTPVSLQLENRAQSPRGAQRAPPTGGCANTVALPLQSSLSAPTLPARPGTDPRAAEPVPPRTGASAASALLGGSDDRRYATGTRSATGLSVARGATGASAMGSTRHAASSMRSRASRATVASMQSRISEAVQREVERSALGDYYALLKGKEDRAREKFFKMPLHLRGGDPITNGQPPNFLTESLRAQTRPVQMAVDPKWSTELKKMNDKAGHRIEYERRLSGSVTGAMLPELPYMYPKKHLSNPPTPYFKPGQRPH